MTNYEHLGHWGGTIGHQDLNLCCKYFLVIIVTTLVGLWTLIKYTRRFFFSFPLFFFIIGGHLIVGNFSLFDAINNTEFYWIQLNWTKLNWIELNISHIYIVSMIHFCTISVLSWIGRQNSINLLTCCKTCVSTTFFLKFSCAFI